MDSSDSPPESKRGGLPERPIRALEQIRHDRRKFRPETFSRTLRTEPSRDSSSEGKSTAQKGPLVPPPSLRQTSQSEDPSSTSLKQRLTFGFSRNRSLVGFTFLMAIVGFLITWHRSFQERNSSVSLPTAGPPHLSESLPTQRPSQKGPPSPPTRRPAHKKSVSPPAEKLAVPAPHGIPKIPIGGGPPGKPLPDALEGGAPQNLPEAASREPANQERSPDGSSSEREDPREEPRSSDGSPSELSPNEWIDPESGRRKRRIWTGRTGRDAYRTVDVTDDADPLAPPEFRPESQ